MEVSHTLLRQLAEEMESPSSRDGYKGVRDSDRVGGGGVTVLPNGDYVASARTGTTADWSMQAQRGGAAGSMGLPVRSMRRVPWWAPLPSIDPDENPFEIILSGAELFVTDD